LYLLQHPSYLQVGDWQSFLGAVSEHHRLQTRLLLLAANDPSPKSLTQKILEHPRLLEQIRQGLYQFKLKVWQIEWGAGAKPPHPHLQLLQFKLV
jgi:hypothetical protein